MIYTNDFSLDKKRISLAVLSTLAISSVLFYFKHDSPPFVVIGMVVSSLMFYIVLRVYLHLMQNNPNKLIWFCKLCSKLIPAILLLPYLFIKDDYGLFIAGVILGLLANVFFAEIKTMKEVIKESKGNNQPHRIRE